ncbi:hypothetical protein BDN72DRAFT_756228 [Pluteus cervinus]|uniref:Uncharacterized protein n=1 Tax=Pluteus cervinus TaxID=181527 RepID=A0ACD3BDQ0_9AGAR|nr:hypothetical protein BDN72DRAFT_756228 [Pluteus cervinus]
MPTAGPSTGAAISTAAPVPITTTLPYFPPYPHHNQQSKPPSPPPERSPSPPDLVNSITPTIASDNLKRLIYNELKHVGFDSAQPGAVYTLELELVAFIEDIFQKAHEYANLANRAGPIATDLLLSCTDYNIPPEALRTIRKRASRRKKDKSVIPPPQMLPPLSRSSSPELLPSDDEDGTPAIPTTLRGIGSYFPDLPPKHTYLRTPASPPKKAALPSLEKKLKTAALVQKSLGNLLSNTEDSTNQEDDKLLGHIVNWEMGIHPRKRWRVGR